MPNPFPGMNPYLEDPVEWEGYHNSLVTYLATALNATLPSGYIARVEVRCYKEQPTNRTRPDVAVRPQTPRPSSTGRVAVAAPQVASAVDPALIFQISSLEVREAYVNIVDTRNREIITAIELLSPTNKTTQNTGYALYRRKQEQTLVSETNLLEIDLLRRGLHTLAVQESLLSTYDYHYAVCLHRGYHPGRFEVWLMTLRDRLPRIAVPLRESEQDVALDLQAVVDRHYADMAYDRDIDYTAEPVGTLSDEDAAWADALLREHGLRP